MTAVMVAFLLFGASGGFNLSAIMILFKYGKTPNADVDPNIREVHRSLSWLGFSLLLLAIGLSVPK